MVRLVSTSTDAPEEPDRYGSLIQRFDQRARRLRKQANVLLGFITAVLIGGAAAFVFANDITNLTLLPQTAETQYAAVEARLKENKAQQDSLRKQIAEILDASSISAPFDGKIHRVVSEYSALEDGLLQHCSNISHTTTADEYAMILVENMSVKVSGGIGGISLSSRHRFTKCSGRKVSPWGSIAQSVGGSEWLDFWILRRASGRRSGASSTWPGCAGRVGLCARAAAGDGFGG